MLDEKEFLKQIDERYEEYEQSDKGHYEADSLKEFLYELLIEYKGGEL